jgi:hypothetical protein
MAKSRHSMRKLLSDKARRTQGGATAKRKAAATPAKKAKAAKGKPAKAKVAKAKLARAKAAKPKVASAKSITRADDQAGTQLKTLAVDSQPFLRETTPRPFKRLPEEIRRSIEALKPTLKRLHGSKFSLAYFPGIVLRSPCADKFGYMSAISTRSSTKLPFDARSRTLLTRLGELMADAGRETSPDSPIPAGFTYVGQFVDHDITLDVSSSLDVETDANTIHNMRSPSLDLDSVYGRGPAMDPFLYAFPTSGNPTAIKLQLGTNLPSGDGGPGGSGGFGGMVAQTDFDVPRMNTAAKTAIIGDPRNDENLIVVQFHHAMLRFHNAIVDKLVADGFTGDIFVEAKRIATHHYQWAVVNDFLERICGKPAVSAAQTSVTAAVGSAFRMPVEFAVAAYRFGHSQIRDTYWLNFNFVNATLGEVFAFNRNPNLPVRSNWVVDFNAFFDTSVSVPVNNKARKIDSVLANGLESLPGFSGMMALLAARNLLRGLALGLPSGQGMAQQFGITPMTTAQLVSGLPTDEVAILRSENGLLLQKTPLWYYVLREAAVLANGDRLGPVGARIVAETFIRILKRDADSYLRASTPFSPTLPGRIAGKFTFADIMIFAGVTQP